MKARVVAKAQADHLTWGGIFELVGLNQLFGDGHARWESFAPSDYLNMESGGTTLPYLQNNVDVTFFTARIPL